MVKRLDSLKTDSETADYKKVSAGLTFDINGVLCREFMTFNQLFNLLYARKVPFLVTFFVVVFLTYMVLFIIDFIPEPVEEEKDTLVTETIEQIDQVEEVTVEPAVEAPVVVSAYPEKIIFDTLDKEVVVSNPDSREVADLDHALLSGAVRHPDSADFKENGNMFILAHSSYLPNVMNKNFQAFNGIQKLTWGDKIRVQSADTEYVYRVDKVYEAKASEVFVPDTPGQSRLTLATCNSFGSKDDRFMVEASLIGSVRI